MPSSVAFPFVLKRGSDVIDGLEITSTVETIHGLLRLELGHLTVQWRVSRSTDVVGLEIRTDKELEPTRETSVPLSAIAGAVVRWKWRWWRPGFHMILTAADLAAFDVISGESGLKLDHPAELVIRVTRSNRAAADEFAGELNLAVAERELRSAESAERLPDEGPRSWLPDGR